MYTTLEEEAPTCAGWKPLFMGVWLMFLAYNRAAKQAFLLYIHSPDAS